MSNGGIKFKKIRDDVYRADVYIFYRQDRDKSIKFLNKNFFDLMGNEGQGFDIAFQTEGAMAYAYKMIDKTWKSKVYLLWLPEEIKTGTLIHEVFHLVDFILNHKGVHTFDTNQDNNEHFAYYLDFWARKVVDYCYEFDRNEKPRRKGRKQVLGL